MQQITQLSDAQAWLSLTLLLNGVGNLLIQNEPSSIGAIALVVSLSAYPHESARLFRPDPRPTI